MASTSTPAPNGILLVDKPQGFTSHDAVARVRRLAGTRKVGHAGTLDPMATGLLIMGLGPSTRLLTYIVGLSKEYFATIRLGSSSTTDDAEGELLGYAPASQLDKVSEEDILAGVRSLTGEIEQIPSSVSAIKVNGKRAYDLARAGESVELKARPVTIYSFEVNNIERGQDEAGHGYIDVQVLVECSSGTYIRALARDLGFKLGVGGHLTSLRRTRIGDFHVMDAVDIEDMAGSPELMTPSDVARKIFPTVDLNETQALELSQGKRVLLEGYPDSAEPVAAIGPQDRLIGLVTVKKNLSRVLVNFPTDTESS
jgi:tRNA pseudouridine55 synthase